MEYLKIDPASEIRDPEEIRMVPVGPYEPAGKSLLCNPGGRLSVFLEIVPEETLPEPDIEQVDLGK